MTSSTMAAAYLPASKSLSGMRAQDAAAFSIIGAHLSFCQEPSMLILDEATSHLGAATERYVTEMVAIADHLISLSRSGVMERDGVPRKARPRQEDQM